MNENDDQGYKGNQSLKKCYINHEFSDFEVQEFIKCSQDVGYFASNYVHVVHPDRGLIPIELYDYQQELLQHFKNNRNSIVLSSRQSGKCCLGSTVVQTRWTENAPIQRITLADLFEKTLQKL